MLCCAVLNIVIHCVVMLSVIRLNVVTLNDVAPVHSFLNYGGYEMGW
jgi:hypothetical protein